MEDAKSAYGHQTFVFFLLTTEKTRKAPSNVLFSIATLTFFLSPIIKYFLIDKGVRDCQLSRQMRVTFGQFYPHDEKDKTVTRKRTEALTDYQNIPSHMKASNHFFAWLRNVLRHNSWCFILYERTELQEEAASFHLQLFFGAANVDFSTCFALFVNMHIRTSRSYGATDFDDIPNLVAFFGKTTTPPVNVRQFYFVEIMLVPIVSVI